VRERDEGKKFNFKRGFKKKGFRVERED